MHPNYPLEKYKHKKTISNPVCETLEATRAGQLSTSPSLIHSMRSKLGHTFSPFCAC